ncbi:hypothetical protein ABEB36_003494 [Hypothenemus hampei]|uniref:THAP-type domain-containing protein n=1 Tax=Hypothenemus hampei TaxID=57062 RepID=A0ABD1F9C3_HYPHA
MPCCVAINCSNRFERGNCRFFGFPANKKRRAKWVQNIGCLSWTPTNASRLCEIHSLRSACSADEWKKLKPNAVSTLFNMPNPSRSTTSVVRSICKKYIITK